MRNETEANARAEVQVLDTISEVLRAKIEAAITGIRRAREVIQDDPGMAIGLHSVEAGLRDSFEELARRGYGRVVMLNEVDEAGKIIGHEIYRVSQANAPLPDAGIRILARNNRNASRLVSCRIGDEIEFSAPKGDRFFDVVGIIDLEGVTPLLQLKPNAALAQFSVITDPVVDAVRDLRAFVGVLDAPASAETKLVESEQRTPSLAPSSSENFWPTNWDNVILGNDESASLGSHFFTRTTREQEAAIQNVRGVTVVEGIAGTGKTSVALGRLKFFANFRSGENLEEYGLDPNDWTDFDPSDMVGFVLNPSLVQYLKQTAERLELGRMKIQDFDEYRDQERQSRRLFGRPFQKSSDRNPATQRTITWLSMLDAVLAGTAASAISKILEEPLPKPDTPDGRSVSQTQWAEFHKRFWEAGPVRARVIGLIRRLRGGGRGAGGIYRLQGVVAALDRDARLSDRELGDIQPNERRAMREAIENVSQRFFRVFNPTELLVAAYADPESLVSKFALTPDAAEAVRNAATRLNENKVTDDDVVTALCLNALTCDRFGRDIANIPYLRDFAGRVAVFIDEYQDFSEQQVLLMAFRARPKYRQITVAGDPSQRLHRDGLSDVVTALPFSGDGIRSIFLDVNHRQTKPLAAFSNSIRKLTERISVAETTAAQAPLTVFDDMVGMAEGAIERIARLPESASVAIICPDRNKAAAWYELMKDGLDGCFRNPVLSERSRLTERFKTHFTTSVDAKGLEFDVVVIPDVSEFSSDDPIEVNGLYVAASRPRYALLLGCNVKKTGRGIVRQLLEAGHLSETAGSTDTLRAS